MFSWVEYVERKVLRKVENRSERMNKGKGKKEEEHLQGKFSQLLRPTSRECARHCGVGVRVFSMHFCYFQLGELRLDE